MLRGHTYVILGLAFSADGGTLVSAGADRTARVWDVATGRERAALRKHGDPISAVAIAAEGRRAVAGGGATVKWWDATTGSEAQTLAVRGARPFATDFAPAAGRRVSLEAGPIPANAGVLALLVEPARSSSATGRPPGSARRFRPAAKGGLAGPPGGDLVAACGPGPVVSLRDGSGREVWALRGHVGEVAHLALSPDGQRLVTAARTGPSGCGTPARARPGSWPGRTGRYGSRSARTGPGSRPATSRVRSSSGTPSRPRWSVATGSRTAAGVPEIHGAGGHAATGSGAASTRLRAAGVVDGRSEHDLLAEREGLEPVPKCADASRVYRLSFIEILLRGHGPIFIYWQKTHGRATYGHASVLIGADDVTGEIIYHDPENAPNSRMSLARFNTKRQKSRSALMRRKGVVSNNVRVEPIIRPRR